MAGPDQSASEDNSAIWPELWQAFEPHRNRICKLLCGLPPSRLKSRLCVLGAGRTTDLDLMELVKHYSQIDLVDIDPSITQEALVQRGFDEHPQVTAYGGVDVTGLAQRWDQLRDSPDEKNLKTLIESCYQFELNLKHYEVVVSTCTLSQILGFAYKTLQNSKLPEELKKKYLPLVVRALRDKHIELLLEHTVPGGSAVLVTDLTSSQALPGILEPNVNLNELLSTDVEQGNHFFGVSPELIYQSTHVPIIARKLADKQITAPWVWDSLEAQYLCVAIRFQRK